MQVENVISDCNYSASIYFNKTKMQIFTALLWLLMDLIAIAVQMSSGWDPSPFQLIHRTNSTTGLTKLACRNSTTIEYLDIHTVNFYVNRSSVHDPDLRNRTGFSVIEEDNMIVFNLTGNSEGIFTCGRRIDEFNIRESPPLILVCKYIQYL